MKEKIREKEGKVKEGEEKREGVRKRRKPRHMRGNSNLRSD